MPPKGIPAKKSTTLAPPKKLKNKKGLPKNEPTQAKKLLPKGKPGQPPRTPPHSGPPGPPQDDPADNKGNGHSNGSDEDVPLPPPPPPPPPQPNDTTPPPSRPHSPVSSVDSESENEDDDESQRRRSRVSPDMILASPPPPPPSPSIPPPPIDNYDFTTLNFEDNRWSILKAGEHQLLKYCYRLQSVFLWLPPATRWTKDVMVVQATRSQVLSALDAVSTKMVTVIDEIRKAWESVARDILPSDSSVDTSDDYWRWRFKECWQKHNTSLKMAQNAQHCNGILRTACMLLREYRNFIQKIATKLNSKKKRDPQAGLRLSKARIKELLLRRKMEALVEEEKMKLKEQRRKSNAFEGKKSIRKAKERVKRLQLEQVHRKLNSLKKELMDRRIHKHLDQEFEPAWRTSVEVSESYIHALRHAIRLEQHHTERKRRRKAKFTCKATKKRVKARVRQNYQNKAHVFVRPLSRLVDIRSSSLMRFSPVQPGTVLHKF